MPKEILQIIKEVLTFIGQKFDALTSKDRVQRVALEGVEKITLQGKNGEPGHTPTDEELLALMQPLIEKLGEMRRPDRNELLALIRPLIPMVRDGETPSDSHLLGLIEPLIPKPIPGRPGKNGSPDTGEEIIDKVNRDESKKKIRKEKVEGWEELEGRVKTAEVNSRPLRLGGDTVYLADLSSQTNGVLKTFTVPPYRRILFLQSSDFPILLMQSNGFTKTATTVTLTTDNAPSSGSQLGMLYVV